MSSLPVAAQRRASPRLPLGLVALVVVLAIGAGAFVGAMAITNRAAPAPSVATSTASGMVFIFSRILDEYSSSFFRSGPERRNWTFAFRKPPPEKAALPAVAP